MRVRTAAAVALLAALGGCASCDRVPDGAVTDCNAQVVPGGAATDLLFVIDDSGSMTDNQAALAANLSQFIDALVASPVHLDLRVGVTNTSIDDYSGRTRYGNASPTSGAAYPGPRNAPFPVGTLVAIAQDGQGAGQFGEFLWGTGYDPTPAVSTWGGPRILSSGPDLARDFKANVHQGEWGSGKEQPLRAMRASLDAAMVGTGANFGLLRSGARLAVVILTDEDDCSESGTPKAITSDNVCRSRAVNDAAFDRLADFVDYLDSTVAGVSGAPPIVAAIAGFDASGATSLCASSTGSAAALPRRLGAFLDGLEAAHPGRTAKLSICRPFGEALLTIASMIVPQTMPLQRAPQDWRLLAVSLVRASGAVTGCRMAEAGSADAAGADVLFTPPQPGALASLSFQGGCRLGVGDRVDLQIVCAR